MQCTLYIKTLVNLSALLAFDIHYLKTCLQNIPQLIYLLYFYFLDLFYLPYSYFQ